MHYLEEYRVTKVVGDLDVPLSTVPLSAKFCLGRWELGRIGEATWWNIQFKVNPTHMSLTTFVAVL